MLPTYATMPTPNANRRRIILNGDTFRAVPRRFGRIAKPVVDGRGSPP
jgi:hypothetical protein